MIHCQEGKKVVIYCPKCQEEVCPKVAFVPIGEAFICPQCGIRLTCVTDGTRKEQFAWGY